MIEYVTMTADGVLSWLGEDPAHVLEYSPDLHRAYIHDEDSDDRQRYIPVAIARDLLSAGDIIIWRYIGKYNRGYSTYRPTAWVAAWKQRYPIEVEADA